MLWGARGQTPYLGPATSASGLAWSPGAEQATREALRPLSPGAVLMDTRGLWPVTLASAAQMTQALSRPQKEAFALELLVRGAASHGSQHVRGSAKRPVPRLAVMRARCRPRPGVAVFKLQSRKSLRVPPRSWVLLGEQRPGLGSGAFSHGAVWAAPAHSNLFTATRRGDWDALGRRACERRSAESPQENMPGVLLRDGRGSLCPRILKCTPAFNKPAAACVRDPRAKSDS